jgi:hypothetical protein
MRLAYVELNERDYAWYYKRFDQHGRAPRAELRMFNLDRGGGLFEQPAGGERQPDSYSVYGCKTASWHNDARFRNVSDRRQCAQRNTDFGH